jgi:hypothetical protein
MRLLKYYIAALPHVLAIDSKPHPVADSTFGNRPFAVKASANSDPSPAAIKVGPGYSWADPSLSRERAHSAQNRSWQGGYWYNFREQSAAFLTSSFTYPLLAQIARPAGLSVFLVLAVRKRIGCRLRLDL